ncbi:MAG: two-component system LytT family response regulator [Bacteroidia bacterium]|jgi:two-component system LytT family response regulator
MIKIGIVEDIPDYAAMLKTYVEQHTAFEVVAVCGSVAEAIEQVDKTKPDLMLLDIELDMETTFDILEHYKKMGTVPFDFVFVTSRKETFGVQAFNYGEMRQHFGNLSKPIDPDRLNEILEDYANRKGIESKASNFEIKLHSLDLLKAQMASLSIPDNNGYKIVRVSEIVYLEMEDKYTIFHFAKGSSYKWDKMDRTSSKRIGEYGKILEPLSFLRIHKSTLVNTRYITQYKRSGELFLEGVDNALMVSQRMKKQVEGILGALSPR